MVFIKKSKIDYPKTVVKKKKKQILNFLNWFNWQYLQNQNYNKYKKLKDIYLIKQQYLKNLLFFYSNFKLKHLYCKKTKRLSNKKTINFLQKFELRLDILIAKLLFKNTQLIYYYIKHGFISVNNIKQNTKYICQVFDCIALNYMFNNTKFKLFNISCYSFFLLSNVKLNDYFNYLEVDRKIQNYIILRVPFFFEITNFKLLKKKFVKILHLQIKLIHNMY